MLNKQRHVYDSLGFGCVRICSCAIVLWCDLLSLMQGVEKDFLVQNLFVLLFEIIMFCNELIIIASLEINPLSFFGGIP